MRFASKLGRKAISAVVEQSFVCRAMHVGLDALFVPPIKA